MNQYEEIPVAPFVIRYTFFDTDMVAGASAVSVRHIHRIRKLACTLLRRRSAYFPFYFIYLDRVFCVLKKAFSCLIIPSTGIISREGKCFLTSLRDGPIEGDISLVSFQANRR
ncbi:hypothetical protein FQZ97_1086460 [compost metagenome]